MIVFDIGYNDGNFSNDIRNHYPDSVIIAVDGDERFYKKFVESTHKNIEFIHAVVADVDSEKYPFMIPSVPNISTINPLWIEHSRHNRYFHEQTTTHYVKSIKLDTMIEKYGTPDIIKLDVEGAEHIVLKGLTKKINLVTFEWCEELFSETIKCVEYLKKIGFSEFSNTEQTDKYHPDLNFFPWESSGIQNDIIPERKHRWGMIYAR